ncbi:unnamed protein product [Sphenostylis stenocarpa]|uniref:Uncharacterized protein n=1 Tax=Sphenostylis stenocarpa TaxID=92480 RepID=A0AA86T9S1_9FABA|nr:unnamed protein product [Sphenostylis stenocarpa]
MRGGGQTKDLLFDPKIEKTARRNNSRIRKQKELNKERQQQEDTYIPILREQLEQMVDPGGVVTNGDIGGEGHNYNNQRRLLG